jgi:hypothetical protein
MVNTCWIMRARARTCCAPAAAAEGRPMGFFAAAIEELSGDGSGRPVESDRRRRGCGVAERLDRSVNPGKCQPCARFFRFNRDRRVEAGLRALAATIVTRRAETRKRLRSRFARPERDRPEGLRPHATQTAKERGRPRRLWFHITTLRAETGH